MKYGFRNHRGRVRAYRASGKMFGQTFHTGTSWPSFRPPAKECPHGYMLEVYTDPCERGCTWWNLPDKAQGGEA